MFEIVEILQGICERGLIFSIVVASVYLSSRLINFDNLAVEGAFGLGGALTALLLSWHINPWLAFIAAGIIGGLSGIVTGLLYTKVKLNNLISGIVVTTGAFSLMIKIAGANLTLAGKKTIFSLMPSFIVPYQSLVLLLIICLLFLYGISWLLKTEIGFLLVAVGDTPQMVINVGKSVAGYLITGLTISNTLAGIAGGLFVQYTGYFSIWASVGVLIIGLAGLICAQAISTNFGLALLIGSIAYQAIIALTFELEVDQDWNKLITALLIVVLIMLKQWMLTHKKEESRC